jgi:hypothetical protein
LIIYTTGPYNASIGPPVVDCLMQPSLCALQHTWLSTWADEAKLLSVSKKDGRRLGALLDQLQLGSRSTVGVLVAARSQTDSLYGTLFCSSSKYFLFPSFVNPSNALISPAKPTETKAQWKNRALFTFLEKLDAFQVLAGLFVCQSVRGCGGE